MGDAGREAERGVIWVSGSPDGAFGRLPENAKAACTQSPLLREKVREKAKSVKFYVEQFEPKQAVRFSMADYREQDWLANVPLYNF